MLRRLFVCVLPTVIACRSEPEPSSVDFIVAEMRAATSAPGSYRYPGSTGITDPSVWIGQFWIIPPDRPCDASSIRGDEAGSLAQDRGDWVHQSSDWELLASAMFTSSQEYHAGLEVGLLQAGSHYSSDEKVELTVAHEAVETTKTGRWKAEVDALQQEYPNQCVLVVDHVSHYMVTKRIWTREEHSDAAELSSYLKVGRDEFVENKAESSLECCVA